MTGFRVLAFILLFTAGSGSLSARSIWRDRNVYSSAGNIRVGDVLVVKINDISRMRFTLNLDTQTSSEVTSNPDVTITGFLPRVTSNRSHTYRNRTGLNERGQLNLSIAATVTGRGAGRTYSITGTRVYSFNGTSNTISVTGLVEPTLINGRNIDSSNIVNFRIQIRGRGEGITITRPPLKKDETAGSALTEQEKQQIIINYLQKILSELEK